jgi:hypothetical protein
MIITILILVIGLAVSINTIHDKNVQIVEMSEQIQTLKRIANKRVEQVPETQPVPEQEPENIEETTTDVPLTTVEYEDIPKYKELGTFKITGYTPTCTHCCGKSDSIGASGRKVIVGETVAMNRTDMRNYGLEYGDKIYIEGIGERVIVDTGCGQGVVDVACDSHESCRDVTGYYRVHYIREGGAE